MIRPLKGRAVIRERKPSSDVLVLLDGNPREEKSHRGTVLALGDPAECPNGAPIPWGCEVGDEVVYVWHHMEKLTTAPWDDGKPASWVPHTSILAVVEP